MDIVVFPKLYAQTKEQWVEQKPVLITGKLDLRDDVVNMLADSIETVATLKEKGGTLKITIPMGTESQKLKELKDLLETSPGSQKAILVFDGMNHEVEVPFTILWNQDLSRKIAMLLSEQPLQN